MKDFRTTDEVNERVTRAVGESTQGNTPTTSPTNWTPAELRGIPAVGYHCGSGAIRGTEPGWNLDDWPIPAVA